MAFVYKLAAVSMLPTKLGQAMPRTRITLPMVHRASGPWNVVKSRRFKSIKLLGQGSFGKAYSATRNGQKVIVKVASGERGVVSQHEAYQALYREFLILGKLQKFPFIPRLIEVGPDYFVQEDVGGESMLKILAQKGLEAREILSVVVATGLMISKIHEMGIAHRDLEARNILLTPQGAVIIDFGIAIEKSESESQWKRGIKQDLVSLLEDVVLAASATDVTQGEKIIMAGVIEKFRKKALEGSVNEKTARELSDDLLYVLAQLGAKAIRGQIHRKEKVKVRVI